MSTDVVSQSSNRSFTSTVSPSITTSLVATSIVASINTNLTKSSKKATFTNLIASTKKISSIRSFAATASLLTTLKTSEIGQNISTAKTTLFALKTPRTSLFEIYSTNIRTSGTLGPTKSLSSSPSQSSLAYLASSSVIQTPPVSPVTERKGLDVDLILIIAGSVAGVLIIALVCCLRCQRRRLQKKLDKHEKQIQELRDLRDKLSSNKSDDAKHSDVQLDPYQRHQHNRNLMDEQGSEFIGFRNEMFQPDVVQSTRKQGKRPSIGPGDVSSYSHVRSRLRRIDSLSSEDDFDFPPPPPPLPPQLPPPQPPSVFERRHPPATPAPPPPPPPPPSSSSDNTNQRKLVKNDADKEIKRPSSPPKSPLISLLDEFKNKVKTQDAISEEEGDGRLVRASTLLSSTLNQDEHERTLKSRAASDSDTMSKHPPKVFAKPNNNISFKSPGASHCSSNRNDLKKTPKQNVKSKEKEASSRRNVIEEENEFTGFHNKRFNPEIPEMSSRF